MQPEQMIASAIERCGCSLEFLQAEGSVVLKAYLNPLRERAARTEGGASGMDDGCCWRPVRSRW